VSVCVCECCHKSRFMSCVLLRRWTQTRARPKFRDAQIFNYSRHAVDGPGMPRLRQTYLGQACSERAGAQSGRLALAALETGSLQPARLRATTSERASE